MICNLSFLILQFVGSTQISFPEDTIELHKMDGNESKPWKCDFVIKLNGDKMHFAVGQLDSSDIIEIFSMKR